jgi:hypothetical protein
MNRAKESVIAALLVFVSSPSIMPLRFEANVGV